jgi:hypothetical protein
MLIVITCAACISFFIVPSVCLGSPYYYYFVSRYLGTFILHVVPLVPTFESLITFSNTTILILTLLLTRFRVYLTMPFRVCANLNSFKALSNLFLIMVRTSLKPINKENVLILCSEVFYRICLMD